MFNLTSKWAKWCSHASQKLYSLALYGRFWLSNAIFRMHLHGNNSKNESRTPTMEHGKMPPNYFGKFIVFREKKANQTAPKAVKRKHTVCVSVCFKIYKNKFVLKNQRRISFSQCNSKAEVNIARNSLDNGR